MASYTKPIANLFRGSASFVTRQDRDWRVTVARSALDKLAYQTVYPYLSIYIVALGATATQLGLVNSLGMGLAALFGPLNGWLIDRSGPKRIYLTGIGLVGVSYLTYGLAHSWPLTILAMTVYWLGFSTSNVSCNVICGNCLPNCDRATGMMVCETVAAGLLGMAGPLMATWIIARTGGVNVEGIRPLFFVALAVSMIAFIMVATQLSGRKWSKGIALTNPITQITSILKGNPILRRWLPISAVSQVPQGLVLPFAMVFAHQIKGADELTLGIMVTASALTSILLAIPAGRLADRIGRKKVLYVTMPLFWASNLALILAPNMGFLVLAGALQGFYYIGSPISAAIERELVPHEMMGRWVGTNRFCKLIVGACLAFVGGMIWDRLGPQYVFLAFIGIDSLVRLPMLVGMPETLHMKGGLTPGAKPAA